MIIEYRNLQSDTDWKWLTARADPVLTTATTGIVAIDKNTASIVAMACFDSWTETSAQIHWAIDKPMVLRHGFVEEIFNYLFNTCGKEILLAGIPADNIKSLKLGVHLGMKVIYRIGDGVKRGVDLVLMEQRKENCKWLRSATNG